MKVNGYLIGLVFLVFPFSILVLFPGWFGLQYEKKKRADFVESTEYRWQDPSECQKAASAEYVTVTVDGVAYYCDGVEMVAGFPMTVIMHRGEDVMIVRAKSSLAIEER